MSTSLHACVLAQRMRTNEIRPHKMLYISYNTPRKAVSDIQSPPTQALSALVFGDCISDTAFLGVLYILHNYNVLQVLLSSDPNCDDGSITVQHAVPGTTVSVSCSVDNPNGAANLLTWTIPPYGVSVPTFNPLIPIDAYRRHKNVILFLRHF